MPIKLIAVGKKHESWVNEGINRYEMRLKKPFLTEWQLLPHSAREGDAARKEESERILQRIKSDDFVILLDEKGRQCDSPALSRLLNEQLEGSRPVVVIIGGAYGVDGSIHQRADYVWSLSPLVFPHQLVRLMVVEQLYRAQEIASGGSYHHM
jgi:23S rRNA (pseudouridine1915-N3)-methyltransferase